jgi:hypothetical protein
MKKSVTFIGLIIVGILMFITAHGFGQQRMDTAIYVPQINITAASGFGPYIIGERQNDLIVAENLPPSTSKVTFRFLDIDGNPVGEGFIKTGTNLESATWEVALDSLDLPLSPGLNVELIFGSNSLAEYFIPYAVYPDTMIVASSQGFGPFISNDYQLSDTMWQAVPEVYTTFTAKVLPPRTEEVVFYLMNETAAIDSFYVSTLPGMYMDSAQWENVRMDALPLSTWQLKVVAYCHGGPDFGISIEKDLKLDIQKPALFCHTKGSMFSDSIPPAIQNQTDGHVLLVDSIKNMVVTNMPAPNNFYPDKGSYSFTFYRDWSLESWIRLDLDKILNGEEGRMSFIKVDSAWEIVVENQPDLNSLKFVVNCLIQDDFDIAEAEVSYDDLQGKEWHYVAFTNIMSLGYKTFYFDGNPLPSTVNNVHLEYLEHHLSQYLPLLKTRPLYFGGCNAGAKRRSDDLSLITAMDEIRAWNRCLTADEVKDFYSRPILQSENLLGYWSFNDLNCNGLNVSDLSYQCNNGILQNGAKLIEQYPGVQESIDTLVFWSSHALTDSVKFEFIDKSNILNYSLIVYPVGGKSTLYFDIETLPFTTNLLRTTEYYPGNNGGKTTIYPLLIYPPQPIATIRTGWGNYYASSPDGIQYINDTSILYNPVTISGLPSKTSNITLGFENGGTISDTSNYTITANPYHHSLSLNGTDNYIESDWILFNPGPVFTMMFWFKTTTEAGGIMTGYKAQSLSDKDGPYVKMKPDGAIEFSLHLNDTLRTLYASNKFNDGEWHHLAASWDGSTTHTASLFIDGTLTDRQTFEGEHRLHRSRYYVGKNFVNPPDKEIAQFFQGSFSEICEYNVALDYEYINQQMYIQEKHLHVGDKLVMYYKLDEGQGMVIHSAIENPKNAALHGTRGLWYLDNNLSYATWNKNVISETPGQYTFFADVFYNGGPEQGMRYPLGRFNIIDPVPGYQMTYNLEDGIGYFDEGTIIENVLKLWTNFHKNEALHWFGNRIKVVLKDPWGDVLFQKSHPYFGESITIFDTIDMGEVITGSYIMIEYGHDSLGIFKQSASNCIPIFTRTILPPKVIGNFGPFDQAIAPGTMVHNNRFKIITEVYDDLDSVDVNFYNTRNELVANTAAQKYNDTTWYIDYDMSQLSPPYTRMNIGYYLGDDQVPALVEGPFIIKINRTRPFWFDFIKVDDFKNVVQVPGSDTVTFEIETPFEDMRDYHQSSQLEIPDYIPIIGGSTSEMGAPTANASLVYFIPDYKLTLTDCDIKNKIWDIGAGNGRVAFINVNVYNNSSFYLDDQNNLFATQNMGEGGQVSSPFTKYSAIADKLKHLVSLLGLSNPVVSPSFSLTFSIGFQYSGRKHLMIDTIAQTGDWGSVGNLDVEADPAEDPEAYNESASFHFYAGSIAGNLEIGLELFEGLVEAGFCTSLRFDLGFGKSYISVPYQDDKLLKSFTIDIYGKIVVRAMWGWVESTVWGPQMFYTKNVWGDNMENCFLPAGKNCINPLAVASGGDRPELVSQVMPASWYNKTPMAYPEASITASDDYQLFTWVERGEKDGDRRIRTKYLDKTLQKFSDDMTIENNDHLINGAFTDAISDKNVLLTWAQSRYQGKNLVKIKGEDMIRSFAESQDIWYAVYNIENDSLLQTVMIADDTKSLRSGRSEAKPVITSLSDTKALISWQVADLETHIADIWCVELNKENGTWNNTEPKIIVQSEGIETNLKIASPEEDMAVLVWLNTSNAKITKNKIQYAVYSDGSWGIPQIVVDEPDHFYNYLNMTFNNEMGGLVYTTFVEDSASLHHEELSLIPWDFTSNVWNLNENTQLMTDTICHLSCPCISIRGDGTTAIAVKIEELAPKFPNSKISQVNLFTGDLLNSRESWNHYIANEFICDTTKQVADLAISFIGQDTLMILTHEFVMNATNSSFQPINGVFFGDPYMNLVLRSFRVAENNTVINIEEHNYFTGIDEPLIPKNKLSLNQNYPNPTKGETTITFEIPDNSPTTAELFDMMGQRIATLLDLKMIAGEYSLTLNTASLAPGSYVCQLRSCGEVAKIIIIVTK